jgi:hypothetical protein
MLWIQRSRGFQPWPAIVLLVLMGAGGWFVARSLVGLQQWIENGVFLWANQAHRDSGPSRESRTAIGRKGRVGGSSRVVLKISNEGTRPMPSLLRVASYSEWREGTKWIAPPGAFEKVSQSSEDWILDSDPSLAGAVQIQWARASTDDLAPLPGNTVTLRGLVANNVERSALGTVRVESRPRVLSFSAEHATVNSWEGEPVLVDREGVPASERPMIQAVASELRLDQLAPDDALQRLREFFINEFRYTTRLTDTPAADPRATTALGRFLLGHRTGHCEYFATAAVLLLRAAVVPARYTTGYLIDPFQAEGDVITVRESEAHAWVRVFIDGAWRDFDPTPPSDFANATEARGWFDRVRRRLNELRFALASWWWLGEKRVLGQVHWLALPFLGGLLWRLRRLRTTRADPGGRPANPSRFTGFGLDSEWFLVEQRLARRGWEKRHRESAAAWRERLESAGWIADDLGAASRARHLHERLRFDPEGLNPLERADLRRLAHEILQRVEQIGVSARP